ncbi:hypothetical protein NDU88_002753 [Pleurodeles waltl]|uniref:Uncharacterized protein n=1 Tax=Pleurodeles waltl TaxID=8319 RepID=A0AAV7LEZ2_PLEWA|nr:hypothetical protein NDU88_002753 [Pleurodeles waltl]
MQWGPQQLLPRPGDSRLAPQSACLPPRPVDLPRVFYFLMAIVITLLLRKGGLPQTGLRLPRLPPRGSHGLFSFLIYRGGSGPLVPHLPSSPTGGRPPPRYQPLGPAQLSPPGAPSSFCAGPTSLRSSWPLRAGPARQNRPLPRGGGRRSWFTGPGLSLLSPQSAPLLLYLPGPELAPGCSRGPPPRTLSRATNRLGRLRPPLSQAHPLAPLELPLHSAVPPLHLRTGRAMAGSPVGGLSFRPPSSGRQSDSGHVQAGCHLHSALVWPVTSQPARDRARITGGNYWCRMARALTDG